jgi:hypothetical protein
MLPESDGIRPAPWLRLRGCPSNENKLKPNSACLQLSEQPAAPDEDDGLWALLNRALKDIPKIIVTFAKRAASAKRGTVATAHAGHHAKMVINNLRWISELRVNRLLLKAPTRGIIAGRVRMRVRMRVGAGVWTRVGVLTRVRTLRGASLLCLSRGWHTDHRK